MIPRGSEPRQGTKITLVAVHTAEGATTAQSLENYLDQPAVEASYHVLIDDDHTVTYLPDDVAAWAMLSGNHRSVQLCFTGFAKWPRSEWLAHDAMLRHAADVARAWCHKYGIPAVKLTPTQVGADMSGVMGHWDWTLGKKDGTHTDPGPGFPWDLFINYVNQGSPAPTPQKASPAVLMPILMTGQGNLRFPCPIGSTSSIIARGWLSINVNGPRTPAEKAVWKPGHFDLYYQDDQRGIGETHWDIDFDIPNGRSARKWTEIPNGTTQINIEYNVNGTAMVTLELLPK